MRAPRFVRVWCAFLLFMGSMLSVMGLLLLPGWLLVRAGLPAWTGLVLTVLLSSLLWTWWMLSPASMRVGRWLIRVMEPTP